MKAKVSAYVILTLLLVAVDYGAVRELARRPRNPAFEYIVLAVSTLILATVLARLFGKKS